MKRKHKPTMREMVEDIREKLRNPTPRKLFVAVVVISIYTGLLGASAVTSLMDILAKADLYRLPPLPAMWELVLMGVLSVGLFVAGMWLLHWMFKQLPEEFEEEESPETPKLWRYP